MKIFDIYFLWLHIAPSYYGLMYALWFIIWYYTLSKRKFLKENELDSLVTYIFFWVILGWRLWYILFYDFRYYQNNISEIYKFWHWWMSFHGWVIWVIIAMYIFCKVYKKSIFTVWDNVTSILPIWLWLWRIWNYLNKELLWRTYTWPLAVEKWGQYYFPSPLLEAVLEWLMLYLIVNYYFKKSKNPWYSSWIFLIAYAIFRILVEFLRQPDVQIWYIFWIFTIWQILSIPMLLYWTYLIKRKNEWR